MSQNNQSIKVPMSTWVMWTFASLFYAYQYILRVLPNIMMPEIMAKFQIDASIFGQFSGFYYLGYAGMHIPIGILLDRIGPKVIMPLSILLTVFGLFPLIYTDTWLYPSLGRALIGMGSSGAILGVFKVIRMGFPEYQFTRMLGISVTIGLIGAIYGGQPINYLLSIFGWQNVLNGIMILGLGLAICTYFSIPQQPGSDKIKPSFWKDVFTVLRCKKVWVVCLLAGLMVGPLEGFADVWGTEYLKSVYHFNNALASTLPSFIFLGMCFGSPLLSYWAEKTNAYYEITIFAAGIMALSYIALLSGSLTSSMMMILFMIVGVMCSYQILMIYKASTYVREQVVGLTTACANMIIMVFGYFFHSTIGTLLTGLWDGRMDDHIPVYSAQAFTVALSIIPLGLCLAAVGYAFIRYQERKNVTLRKVHSF
jgi:predicted MFS family arabinose efflux permease